MSQHTPGPWITKGPSSGNLRGFDDGGDYAVIAEGQIIADVIHRTGQDSFQDAQANARLIAAAPEMYDLIKNIAGLREHGLDDPAWIWKTARALLARIEGA